MTEKRFPIQAKRLKAVLKDLHVKQIDIVRALEGRTSISKERFSDFCNGNRQITEGVLQEMKMCFFINPDYIKGKSDDMYDIPTTILNYAFLYAEKIVITENPNRKVKDADENLENEKYLHITMEKRLYNYLINLDSLKISSLDDPEIMEKLKKIYKTSKKEMDEYVLLPKNVLFDIIKSDKKERRIFQELIDAAEYKEWNDAKKEFTLQRKETKCKEKNKSIFKS